MTKFELENYFGAIAQMPQNCVDLMVAAFDIMLYTAGTILAQQGEKAHAEYLLFSGQVACSISDPNGQEVSTGFYVGTSVLPPHISRTRNNQSLINMGVTSTAAIAAINVDDLMALMVANEPIRNWGNDVMRAELQKRSEHQWALTALNNKQKLVWFRSNFEAFEDKFEHWRIASYLGMTPVSFSRARGQLADRV